MHEVLQQNEKGWYYQLDENLQRNAMAYPPGPIPCSTTIAIDMTEANSLRKKLGRESGVQVSATSLIIKAAANILPGFPILCGMWESMDRIRCPDPGEIDINGPIQVGDTIGFFFIDKANQKTLFQISRELEAQVNELKSKLANEVTWPEGQPPPSFCISNIGTLGPVEEGYGPVAWFATSILGICSILEKPVVKERQIVIRQMMNAVLGWDHRAMMASTPVEFLNRLKRNLEEPDTYLA
jgi:pyruvate dehydrogenase E2 component (dihydrolipoamide acetyltransferase)